MNTWALQLNTCFTSFMSCKAGFKALVYRLGMAYTERDSVWISVQTEIVLLLLLLSCFSRVRLCATPWTAAYQASPSMGFSRQEHWSGVPLPFPWDCTVWIKLMPLNCGGRLLRVPWASRRSNQSILREINPEYSVERTDAEVETPVFWSSDANNWQLTDWKSPWCWKRLTAEGEEGLRGWEGSRGRMASLMQWTWTWANFARWWGTERPGMLQPMGLQRVRRDWTTTTSST